MNEWTTELLEETVGTIIGGDGQEQKKREADFQDSDKGGQAFLLRSAQLSQQPRQFDESLPCADASLLDARRDCS